MFKVVHQALYVLAVLCNPTILLLTSSSMALTNSAALGVSELDGRTDRREEVWAKREREMRGLRKGKKRRALEPDRTKYLTPISANCSINTEKMVPSVI